MVGKCGEDCPNSFGCVRLWAEGAGGPLATLRHEHGAVNAVSFSPDGMRLASAGDDCAVRLWDEATAQPLLALKGHSDGVITVAFRAMFISSITA